MIKKCKYCGTTEDLYIRPNGRIMNFCKLHFKLYNQEAGKKIKENRRKKQKCKYCGTIENLYKNKTSVMPVCIEHYEIYKNERTDKIKNTMYDKYGAKFALKLDVFKNKVKQTNIKKYGVEHHLKLKEQLDKQKNTNIQKYGVENVFQSDKIKEKTINTNMQKYGVDFPSKLDIIKNKTKKTIKEKYGSHKIIRQKSLKTSRNNYWNTFIVKLNLKQIIPLFNKESYVTGSEFKFKCLRCDKEFNSSETNPQKIYCNSCIKSKSQCEDEIYNWLKLIDNNLIVEKNKRRVVEKNSRLELDLYLPDYKLGIDFHGIYWHSEVYKDNNYHQEKWKLFKEQNINVIQIFENEWINKQDIVKSIILSKLNINQTKIYARQTKIKEIDNNLYREFLEQNHIQGPIASKIKLGMFYNNELVSVIGISKSRFKKDEMEIIRYCTKLNTHIIGGLSKFLSYIKKNYQFDNLISYIDLRYFNGSGYEKAGFKLESITKSNYYYFKNNEMNLYSRIQFQKHKLKNKLGKFDNKLTEYENMLMNGYLRIFDAGNYKMRLN